MQKNFTDDSVFINVDVEKNFTEDRLCLTFRDGEKRPLFHFHKHKNHNVIYECFVDYLCLQLPMAMSYCLGFKWSNTFLGKGIFSGSNSRRPPKRPLTIKDYTVWYFSALHLHRQKRLYFKNLNEKLPKSSIVSVKKLWSERIEKHVDIRIRFKGGQLILTNLNPNIMVEFSKSFKSYFHQYTPVIGKGEKWSTLPTNFNKSYPKESMFIDIYSDELEVSPIPRIADKRLEIFPWKFDTNESLISYVNSMVVKQLKHGLKNDYNAEKYFFTMSISYNFQIVLLMGIHLKVYFGENLSYLLGLPNETLPTPHDIHLRQYYNESKRDISILSFRPMVNIAKRQRQIFVLCSLIKPTAYGVNHLPILREFVHENANDQSISEMRFDPIIYLPLKTNFIENINIQITDTNYKPVEIKDCKTMITLFFRKVKDNDNIVAIH